MVGKFENGFRKYVHLYLTYILKCMRDTTNYSVIKDHAYIRVRCLWDVQRNSNWALWLLK